jgi:cytochrome c
MSSFSWGRAAMKVFRIVYFSAVAMVLATGAGLAQRPSPFGFDYLRAEQAAGRRIFNDHCAACHTFHRAHLFIFGPSLEGVVGRPAGSLPGFPYSDALKNSGLVWTEDNLQKWIADSSHMVPNTLMEHVSISDPAEQIYVVQYLKTLRGKAPASKAKP